jgi:crossover junction endodeoxyribonuclease RusA
MIVLTLPYPISANRYWRPVHIGKHITIVPTKDAKQYRTDIAWMATASGVHAPIKGRLAVTIALYPHRPLDWQARQRKDGDAWDDSVECIDLDNTVKVLLDSLKGVAFDDDKWVRKLQCERMEPDTKGKRVVVTIEPYKRPVPVEQLALMDLPVPEELPF